MTVRRKFGKAGRTCKLPRQADAAGVMSVGRGVTPFRTGRYWLRDSFRSTCYQPHAGTSSSTAARVEHSCPPALRSRSTQRATLITARHRFRAWLSWLSSVRKGRIDARVPWTLVVLNWVSTKSKEPQLITNPMMERCRLRRLEWSNSDRSTSPRW
jgi:hypothetical protein